MDRAIIIFTKQYKIRSLTDNLQQISFKFMKVLLTLEAFERAPPMRPNKAETAVHGCLIPARVFCKYVPKDQT